MRKGQNDKGGSRTTMRDFGVNGWPRFQKRPRRPLGLKVQPVRWKGQGCGCGTGKGARRSNFKILKVES
ncbi:hypothetical protein TorRG33x02_154960 [Trema orientale]|uniref:Uncharacterized protein n=1 Tax=Trema orientale TaxID=63057 RepID=A0A2P5ETC6_TREOI|nr:hypothetical protein TorRG33x02_154960 [Trema orientale]